MPEAETNHTAERFQRFEVGTLCNSQTSLVTVLRLRTTERKRDLRCWRMDNATRSLELLGAQEGLLLVEVAWLLVLMNY